MSERESVDLFPFVSERLAARVGFALLYGVPCAWTWASFQRLGPELHAPFLWALAAVGLWLAALLAVRYSSSGHRWLVVGTLGAGAMAALVSAESVLRMDPLPFLFVTLGYGTFAELVRPRRNPSRDDVEIQPDPSSATG